MRVAALPLLLAAIMLPQSRSQEPNNDESGVETRLAELEKEVASISRELKELRRDEQDRKNLTGLPQLNGRWRYVTATEGEIVTKYTGAKTELVIDGAKWTTLVNDHYLGSDTHSVEYNFDTNPDSLVRFAPEWAPSSIAKAIFKIDGDQLIYTTTAFEVPSKHPLHSYSGSPNTVPQSPKTPAQFNPKGTRNTKYVLRRVSCLTTLPDRKSLQFGDDYPGF